AAAAVVWSAAATPVKAQNGKYPKNLQPRTLRAILKHSFDVIIEHAIFSDAYPVYVRPGIFTKNFFLKAAREVGNKAGVDETTKNEAREIFNRFRDDDSFVKVFSELPMTCFQQFQSLSKSLACNNVATHYGLVGITPAQDGKKLASAPFSHFAIQDTLRLWLFVMKGQAAIGFKFINKFVTSFPNDPEMQEPELPIAAVAAAATAVQSALIDTKSGVLIRTRFVEGVLGELYRSHIETLKTIKKDFPGEFHRIMSSLFRSAIGKSDQATADTSFDFNDCDHSDTCDNNDDLVAEFDVPDPSNAIGETLAGGEASKARDAEASE
ncbi:hypothetical protein V5O48_007969, partial [Marasmius crinis-equi]